MTNVGYATLAVIPSFAGFGANLTKGMAAPMLAAGSKAGSLAGTAASTGFGSKFKSASSTAAKGLASPLSSAGAKAGTQAGATASKGFASKFQSEMHGIGPKLLAGFGAAAVVKQVIGIQGEFEASMNTLAAAADIPAASVRRLGNLAKKMGADTVFSANEAADAMVELAKAGLTPAQIEAGALKGTMALAATEGLRLADAATIMSNAMTTFGIEGDKAVSVADALAGASKASTASVTSISQAMSQVGGSARDAGLNLQETTAALAAFDQEGIKGSDAGTSLKTMLSRLVPQTEKTSGMMKRLGLTFTDANGQFVSLEQMAGRIQRAFSGLSDEERTAALNTIFGSDARRAALALMHQGADGIRDFIKETERAGTAQKLADARMGGTAGAIEKMRGAAEKAGLALGEVLAPAVVGVANAGASLADATGGMVDTFGALPGPVKAAAGAFAALKLAEFAGLTGRVSSGTARMGSAFTGLRIRAMLAADAFREARAGSLVLTGNSGKFTAPVGRMTASLSALRAGAVGVGGALRKGLGGAVGMLGGPWGIAIAGGVALLAKFQANSAEARAKVEEFTVALDQQTGALTKTNRELAAKALQESGALDAARKLGIGLGDVTSAALGNENAIRRVNTALAALRAEQTAAQSNNRRVANVQTLQDSTIQDIGKVSDAIGTQQGVVAGARAEWRNLAEATGESAGANKVAAATTRNYADEIEKAKDLVHDLYVNEQKRRDARVADRRDQIALIQAQIDARKEARKGKQTLDDQTRAGRENWNALLDLADQWNQSTPKVRNARGAYKQMRQTFVDLADQMNGPNGTRKQAQRLADQFLKFPKRVSTKINTPGMEAAIERLKRLKEYADAISRNVIIDGRKVGATPFNLQGRRRSGGPVQPFGTYRVGELGPELLTMGRTPGYITPMSKVDNSRSMSTTTNWNVGTLVVQDGKDLERKARAKAARQQMGGF